MSVNATNFSSVLFSQKRGAYATSLQSLHYPRRGRVFCDLFVADAHDPTRRRVLMIDNGGNVAPPAPALAYEIGMRSPDRPKGARRGRREHEEGEDCSLAARATFAFTLQPSRMNRTIATAVCIVMQV
jgi:hypothetical protein